MPSKNSIYRTGTRFQILSKELYHKFVEETKIEISWEEFKDIILKTNTEIRKAIIDDVSGFKIPYNLGYFCIIQYKTKKIPTDIQNSAKYDKKIPFINFHSFENIVHIKWFQVNDSIKNSIYTWRLEPCRIFKRQLSAGVQKGKQYSYFTNSDFWNKSKMSRSYYKYYETLMD
jgi:hypothetical protein